MDTGAISLTTVAKASPERELCVRAYRYMLLSRVLDEKLGNLYRGGKIHGGVYLGKGQEALSVSIGISLQKGDVFSPLIRDGAGRLAYGEPLVDAIRTCMGSSLGPMRGRDGNVHRGKLSIGLLPMLSHLGAMISVVNGVLFARRMKGLTGSVGAASIGDGATSTGAFHESLNQAAVEKLPLVLVVANNQYAYSTPTSRQFVCHNLVDKAIGYGVEGHTVDGTDLLACLKTMKLAIQNARNGRGPQLVIGELLRLCGHGEHDDAHYVSASIKQSSLGQDCLRNAEQSLLEHQWADPSTLNLWLGEAQNEVDACVQMVQREPAPNADHEQWLALSDPRSCPDPNTLE